MITLQVNGEPVELERATPLLAYLEKLGVNPKAFDFMDVARELEQAFLK